MKREKKKYNEWKRKEASKIADNKSSDDEKKKKSESQIRENKRAGKGTRSIPH